MGGIDVACVVFFGRDELHPILLVWDNFSDPAALGVFRQSGSAEGAVGFFVWDLLILCEHHSIFQLFLQGSELQGKEASAVSTRQSKQALNGFQDGEWVGAQLWPSLLPVAKSLWSDSHFPSYSATYCKATRYIHSAKPGLSGKSNPVLLLALAA